MGMEIVYNNMSGLYIEIGNIKKAMEMVNNAISINEEMGNLVDVIIEGGSFPMIPSTIIDCSSGNPEVLREGKGKIDIL